MTVYEPYKKSEDSPVHLVASHRGEIEDPFLMVGIVGCAVAYLALCVVVMTS